MLQETGLGCKYNSPKQLDNVALDSKMFLEGILTSVIKYVALGFFCFHQIWLQRKVRFETRITWVLCFSFLPKSTLCVSFPRRITRLAMEVLKCSGLLVGWQEGMEKPRRGGCTCQSIPVRFW